MKKKLIQYFACAIAAMLLLLVACSPSVSWVLVDNSDSGDAVKLCINSELIIDLESNATTGFQWEVVEVSEQGIIEKVNNEYNAPEAGAPVGAGGIERWTFKALNEGTTRLYMEYSQPWQGGTKAAETFTLIVIVE
ncbi:protease inhibitor I42 family protein [Chloroflexota bacterium]